MKKLLLSGIAALFLATGTAHSTDEDIMLLFIAGDDGWGHVTYGHSPAMSCSSVLDAFRKGKEDNKPTRLNLGKVSGRVVEMFCLPPNSEQCIDKLIKDVNEGRIAVAGREDEIAKGCTNP
jgi:hypothetical protein